LRTKVTAVVAIAITSQPPFLAQGGDAER